MNIDYETPLFELRGPAGETWALWADGRATGFPEGAVVVNRAAPLLHALLAKQNIPGPGATDEHGETLFPGGFDAGIGAKGASQSLGSGGEVHGDDVLA